MNKSKIILGVLWGINTVIFTILTIINISCNNIYTAVLSSAGTVFMLTLSLEYFLNASSFDDREIIDIGDCIDSDVENPIYVSEETLNRFLEILNRINVTYEDDIVSELATELINDLVDKLDEEDFNDTKDESI